MSETDKLKNQNRVLKEYIKELSQEVEDLKKQLEPPEEVVWTYSMSGKLPGMTADFEKPPITVVKSNIACKESDRFVLVYLGDRVDLYDRYEKKSLLSYRHFESETKVLKACCAEMNKIQKEHRKLEKDLNTLIDGLKVRIDELVRED